MLSSWSTVGKLACPYYGNDSDAFYQANGFKISWFDNHKKFSFQITLLDAINRDFLRIKLSLPLLHLIDLVRIFCKRLRNWG